MPGKFIPNFLTTLNLLCGCFGAVSVLNGDLQNGVYFLWLAAIFDFSDGFAARLLNAKSEIGKQMDSLADLLSFGFLPSVILFKLISNCEGVGFVPYLAFLVTVFSAIRLAKFNLDTRQTINFIGLPTPASALLISSFPFINKHLNIEEALVCYTLIAIVGLISFLLVSKIRFLGIKFANYNLRENWYKYALAGISLILISFFQVLAIPLIFVLYFLISVFAKHLD